jgi:hypothetical protein
MIAQSILEDTKIFPEHLGLGEEPFGVYYDDIRPEKAFGPKTGVPISRELEDQGQLNMQEVFKQFSCVMGNIWLARKKHRAAYISSEEYGCPGGVFYCTQIDGLPLGVESGTRYKGKEFVLSPGEALLFFSDGVTEAVNEKKRVVRRLPFNGLFRNGPRSSLGRRSIE